MNALVPWLLVISGFIIIAYQIGVYNGYKRSAIEHKRAIEELKRDLNL